MELSLAKLCEVLSRDHTFHIDALKCNVMYILLLLKMLTVHVNVFLFHLMLELNDYTGLFKKSYSDAYR